MKHRPGENHGIGWPPKKHTAGGLHPLHRNRCAPFWQISHLLFKRTRPKKNPIFPRCVSTEKNTKYLFLDRKIKRKERNFLILFYFFCLLFPPFATVLNKNTFPHNNNTSITQIPVFHDHQRQVTFSQLLFASPDLQSNTHSPDQTKYNHTSQDSPTRTKIVMVCTLSRGSLILALSSHRRS